MVSSILHPSVNSDSADSSCGACATTGPAQRHSHGDAERPCQFAMLRSV